MICALLATLSLAPSVVVRLQEANYDFKKARVETLQKSGGLRNHVDVVILGDGYVAADLESGGTYERDAKSAVAELFEVEPFHAYRELFNVYAVYAESFDRGAEARPGEDKLRTIFDCSFDSPEGRLLVYQREENVIRLAKLAPEADIVLVMVNDPRYGGSGGVIWEHTPAPCFSSAPKSIHIAVHELGHSLAHLGDEYADPREADLRPLPEGTQDLPHPNLTRSTCIDVSSPATIAATAKWKHVLALPGAAPRIGAFEGGYYRESGVFRPQERCKMRASADPFCYVCREELALSIHALCGRKFDHAAYHKTYPIPADGK